METWQTEIEKFDLDLAERMRVIERHECCSFGSVFENKLFRRALGYSDKNKQGRPWWLIPGRESSLERYKENHQDRIRKASMAYFWRNYDEKLKYSKDYYHSLSQEQLERRNQRRRQLRAIRRAAAEAVSGSASAAPPLSQ